MTTGHPHDSDRAAAFDEAARRAHDAALARLSPKVRARLAQSRRAAQSGPRATAFRAWPMLALAGTGALALAVGLFALRGADDDGDASPPTVAVEQRPGTAPAAPPRTATSPQAASRPAPAAATTDTPMPTVATDEGDTDAPPDAWLAAEFEPGDDAIGLDTLEENPDFYLWLASNEGLTDVTESL